jgi:hypothetical protein
VFRTKRHPFRTNVGAPTKKYKMNQNKMQKIWSEKKLVAKATRESFDFFRETWFSNGLLLGGDRAIGTIDDRFLHFRRKKSGSIPIMHDDFFKAAEVARVARFFLVHVKQMYQMNKNVPNGHKISQMSVKYSKWPRNI